MNRTLTATVALAAALGIAGFAQAQTTASPSTQPGAPSTTMPMTPGASSLPSASTNPSSTIPSAPAANMGMNPSAAAVSNSTNPPAMNNTRPANSQPSASASADSMGSKQSTMSQPDIEQAQQQLKAQGLYRGAIDGVVGPETEHALMRFQHQNGLPETAALDQQTMDRLSGQGQNQQAAPQSR